jgi:PilZ domain
VAELSSRERRRAPRREVEVPLMLVVDSEASNVMSGAFAVDLSQLGARVRAQVRLQPGQLITVIAGGGSGPEVKSRVIWVSDEGKGCDAGVAFLQPVSLEAPSEK